jgi:hypothetical protein
MFSGVNDTGEKFIAGVNDTGEYSFANISANFRKNSKRPHLSRGNNQKA